MYLSKNGYVIKKESFSNEELVKLKVELRARPLVDSKFSFPGQKPQDSTYPVYIETKNKLYIPKMYGISKFGFPDSVLQNYEGTVWENDVEFKGTLLDRQIEPARILIDNCNEKGGGILTLPTGFGKCMKIDTPIIMYDGTIKMVQDIQVGDLLMGDDSTPRKVLSLARGIDDMYDIIPVKGDKYTVNKEHILVLKNTKKEAWIRNRLSTFDVIWWENNNENSKTFNNETDAHLFLEKIKDKHQQFTEIEVKNYIKQSNNFKHHFKGYRVPVEFPHIDLEIDPYMIGIWLGDGTASQPEITTQDSTIIKYFKENLQQYKCYLQYESNKSNNELKYRINGNGTGNNGCNYFLNILKKYDLINNKHIPHIFKCNSRSNQLKLLAGLLDSDGSYYRGVYEFSQSLEHEQIIDDVIFLCRSLGFACYKNKKTTSWQHNGVKNYGEAWRIIISGSGLEEIPVLCKRKKAEPRKQIKDALVTGIKVKYVNKDEYYGFTIDGNHRYLLSDFTVTHNTVTLLYVLSQLKGKAIVIVNKVPLMNQWISEINKFLPDAKVGILQGQKKINITDCDIVVAMLQSMARIDYPDELFSDFRVCAVDECHNTSSKVFSQVLFKLCCKYTIGLSATPNRSDGCEYVFKWHLGDIVYESTTKRKGKPPIIKLLKIDTTEYKEVATENKFTGQKQIQFTSMLSELVEMPKRNQLIIELVKDLIKKDTGRKLLVLSDRRNHLLVLQNMLDKDLSITFTYGLFLGGMKQKDLDKGRSSQVILATYQAFGEGVSEKELDTLLLLTPKKFIGHLKNATKNESGKLEQIVGRIFRKDHIDRNPLIIDFNDNFSVYKTQSNSRKTFYKQHFTNSILDEQSINLDEINNNNYISSIKTKKKKDKIEEEIDNTKNILEYCILDD